jgi:hypothetical protein
LFTGVDCVSRETKEIKLNKRGGEMRSELEIKKMRSDYLEDFEFLTEKKKFESKPECQHHYEDMKIRKAKIKTLDWVLGLDNKSEVG